MKKGIIILLVMLILLFSACTKKPPAETLPVETEPETTVSIEPELEYVTAQVNGIPAVLETFSRGDTLDIVKAFDEKHYVVKLGIGYGLVEKNLVRIEGEPEYTPWTGYAYQNAQVHSNYRLAGSPVKTLTANTQVEVLDDLGWCVLVTYDGNTGYMRQESLAKKPTGTYSGQSVPERTEGEDGGEISMQFSGMVTLLATRAPQEGTVSGKAMVLADETQIVLGYFDRGDQIPVLSNSADGKKLTVYLDGVFAEISDKYVLSEGENAYADWKGQSNGIISVYADYWMLGSPIDRLNTNTTMTVLHELENCYLVEVNGITGYVEKENIVPAKETVPAETQPEQTKPTESTKPAATSPAVPKEDSTVTVPTEPKKETTPTEATTPTETTEPTEVSTPTEATKPVETPTEPTQPSEPAKDADVEKETTPTVHPEWTPPIL